jgi:hypothetical protein
MKKLLLAFALACLPPLGQFVATANAAVTPCEDMLKDLRAAKSTATLNDSDKQKVEDLEAKGIERCNADDDKRADNLFAEAMKLMGK